MVGRNCGGRGGEIINPDTGVTLRLDQTLGFRQDRLESACFLWHLEDF